MLRGDRVLGAGETQPARRPARGDRGARTARARATARAPSRRDARRHARAVLPPRAARRPAPTRSSPPASRRVWVGQRDPEPDEWRAAGSRQLRRAGHRGASSACCEAECREQHRGFLSRAAARPPLGLAEARGHPRRPHRDGARRVALDHRAGRARARAPAARRRRRGDGRLGHGARATTPSCRSRRGRPARAHARPRAGRRAASRLASARACSATPTPARTWLLTRRGQPAPARSSGERRAGARALLVPDARRPPRPARAHSRLLAREGLTHVFVEGGGGLAAALLRAGLVDELHWFLAPSLLGGDARPALGPLGIATLAQRVAARGARRCAGSARTCTFGPCCRPRGGPA